MNWFLFTVVLIGCLAVLIFIAALSRRKKSVINQIELIGSRAQVDSPMTPEGTVLIQGELWCARSVDNSNIAAHTMVRVVGLSGHLLLVER